MADFLSYAPDEVIAANLTETARHMERIGEMELAHLSELANDILSGNTQSPDFIASLAEQRPRVIVASDAILAQNRTGIEGMQTLHEDWKVTQLCRAIRTGLGLGPREVPTACFPEGEALSPEIAGSMIYQKSNYADEAYLRFAKEIPNSRARYAHSFLLAVNEVVRGQCEYCILPVENSTEGPLNSFSRLIDRYALKIAATYDVPTGDGNRYTRFALVRRDLVWTDPIACDSFFECVIPVENSPTVASLLLGAQLCGLELCRLDSRLCEQEGSAFPATHFVFALRESDLASYLLYLAMLAPDYEPLGLYRHLL